MKNKIFYIISALCLTTTLFAQKEANNWIVGWGLSTSASMAHANYINFNVSPPTVTLATGTFPNNFHHLRATASISDKSGQLLCYSNGWHIWDKNDNIMPNGAGLHGDDNMSQGALIVPLPGSTNLYYVFTLSGPSSAPTTELEFSIVDMSLNGGLGDVQPGAKSIFCNVNNLTEKLTAVRHKNGTDIWIIVHESGSNKFLSFLLTSAGWTGSTIPTPVESTTGISYFQLMGGGCMSPSNDGSKIGVAYGISNLWELYDFDDSTGILSNPLSIPTPAGKEAFDIEFSPNDNVLYGSCAGGTFQWNLAAGTPAAIIASQILISSITQYGIQLAPDGKIYGVAKGSKKSLDVINNPNGFGGPIDCDFVSMGINMVENQLGGLPNMPLNLFPKVDVSATSVCLGDTTQFTFTASAPYDSLRWYFDDPASGAANTSTLVNPEHLYKSPGTFNVKLIVTSNLGATKDTIEYPAVVFSNPTLNLGNDTSICQGDNFLLNASQSKGVTWTYLWHDTSTDSTHLAVIPMTYSVAVTDANGCKSSSAIKVSYLPNPNLGGNTEICAGVTLVLTTGVNEPGAIYLWRDGSTGPTFTVSEPGTYWVNSCNYYDTVNVVLKDCESVLTMPNIFSPNNDGKNDIFSAVFVKGITQVHSTIYNRWGNEIFSSDNPTIGWDGKTSSGKDADDGTYFYIITYTANEGKTAIKKGTVQLVR